MGLKSTLYALLKYSNDLNAIKKGKIGKRIMRRGWGKLTGRMARKWIR